MRTDAKANRDRLLEVAREALIIDPDASLNSIAKTAGVGAGTLYRHFPSREALLASLYRTEIDALAALAPALLKDRSPLEAFCAWCERFAHFGRVKHGVADALRAAVSETDLHDSYRTLVAALELLVAACVKAGSFWPYASPETILVLLSSTLRIAPTADSEVQVKEVLALIVRGLTATKQTRPRMPPGRTQ